MHPNSLAPPGFVAPPPYSAVSPQQMSCSGIPPQAPPPYEFHTGIPAPRPIIVFQNEVFGPEPQNTQCPRCFTRIVTRIKSTPTAVAHVTFLLCCLLGLWCCAPVVYCDSTLTRTKHYCPSCNYHLGQSQ